MRPLCLASGPGLLGKRSFEVVDSGNITVGGASCLSVAKTSWGGLSAVTISSWHGSSAKGNSNVGITSFACCLSPGLFIPMHGGCLFGSSLVGALPELMVVGDYNFNLSSLIHI